MIFDYNYLNGTTLQVCSHLWHHQRICNSQVKDFKVVIEEADPQISNEDCSDIMENIVLPHTLIWYADHPRYNTITT